MGPILNIWKFDLENAIGWSTNGCCNRTHNHKGMFTLMYHVIMGDDPDLKTSKPSPDMFLACCYEERNISEAINDT
uniref:Uncharacterized protein n=1 Tax=Oryza barthii TaxID=65489 RepID=A0A0D3HQ55_9ORYZ